MRKYNFIFFLFFFKSAYAQGFESLSRRIAVHCEANRSGWKGETFHNIRVKLYRMGKLDSIISNFDTLYLVQCYDIESGTYIGKIWNTKGMVDFSYVGYS